MAEELKNLIEKIQREGVQAAEEKAKAIESETRKEAQALLSKAAKDAGKTISDAKKEVQNIKDSGEAALVQAARDTLIALKKEIGDMLNNLIARNVGAALKNESLIEIIKDLIKKETQNEKAQIIVTLKKEDLDRVEKPLLSELSTELRKGITLKPSDEIQGGFLISYDNGRSHYDFTQEALAKYIASAIKPQLSAILNRAAQG